MATTKNDVVELAEAVAQRASDGPDIHHVVRAIGSTANYPQGIITVDEVDAYLRDWMRGGYKLFNTHHAGIQGDAHIMVYVLIKE